MRSLVEDSPQAPPDWMLTYGDLMSLLLTFFIMLVSMSEIKQNDKYQGIADSLQAKFGAAGASHRLVPGEGRPRNPTLAALAVGGRSRRRDVLQAGQGAANNDQSAQAEMPAIAALTEPDKLHLQQLARSLDGKRQEIEIRGYTSSSPRGADSKSPAKLDLAYSRVHQTKQYFIDELQVDPRQIRISIVESAGAAAGIEVSLVQAVGDDRRATLSQQNVPFEKYQNR